MSKSLPAAGDPDPFEHIRRTSEQIRQAMAGPLEAITRNARAVDEMMRGPITQIQEAQQRWLTQSQPAMAQLDDVRRATEYALGGPLRNVEANQRHVQQMLQGPIAALTQYQEAIRRATAAPYATLMRNQQMFLQVMAAAAAASAAESAEAEAINEDETSRWLAEWAAAVAEWAPTRQQAADLLTALSFLIALYVFGLGVSRPDPAGDETVLGAISLLMGAGAALMAYIGRR